MTHPGKKALEANRSEINEIFANLTSKERKTLRMYISKPELDSIAKYVAELEEAISGKTMHDAHNVALERAAKVAMCRHKFWNKHPTKHKVSCDVTACEDIAAAIRGLKT
jgi:hypothetical protein